MSERINHPAHYGGDTPHEVIKCLEHWLTPQEFVGALKFNAIKYLARAGRKDNALEDARKAVWYAQRLAQFLESQNED